MVVFGYDLAYILECFRVVGRRMGEEVEKW
jgi:hypothetical protein